MIHWSTGIRLEEELDPCKEQVASQLATAWSRNHGLVEYLVFPVKHEFEILVDMPVEAQIGGVEAVRPEIRIGESVLEDLVANLQEVVPALSVPRLPAQTGRS